MSRAEVALRERLDFQMRDMAASHARMLLRPLYPEITDEEAAAYVLGVNGAPVTELQLPEGEDLERNASIEIAYYVGRDGDMLTGVLAKLAVVCRRGKA